VLDKVNPAADEEGNSAPGKKKTETQVDDIFYN